MGQDSKSIGTVTGFDPTSAKARVKVGDRETDEIPVLMIATRFKRHFIPLSEGDQVRVLGGLDGGSVDLDGYFGGDVSVPAGVNEHTEVAEYSDGTRITYDTQSSTHTVTGGKFVLNCANVKLDAAGNLWVAGTITDKLGTLTDHNHKDVMPGSSNTGGRV